MLPVSYDICGGDESGDRSRIRPELGQNWVFKWSCWDWLLMRECAVASIILRSRSPANTRASVVECEGLKGGRIYAIVACIRPQAPFETVEILHSRFEIRAWGLRAVWIVDFRRTNRWGLHDHNFHLKTVSYWNILDMHHVSF